MSVTLGCSSNVVIDHILLIQIFLLQGYLSKLK